MNYLFDTNVLIYIIKNHPVINSVEEDLASKNENSLRLISIVTKGEIESIAIQFRWGEKKIEQLKTLLNNFLIIPVDSNQIVGSYAEIDAFSQGKHPIKKSKHTSRNMGKNDLWIAATAAVTDSVLITSDNDFDHLSEVFFKIKKLEV